MTHTASHAMLIRTDPVYARLVTRREASRATLEHLESSDSGYLIDVADRAYVRAARRVRDYRANLGL